MSAVEPPESQRYNSTTSLPRSNSNQLMQQQQQQNASPAPVVSPVPEQPVSAYHPAEDIDSNPFMNGENENLDG